MGGQISFYTYFAFVPVEPQRVRRVSNWPSLPDPTLAIQPQYGKPQASPSGVCRLLESWTGKLTSYIAAF